MTAKKSVGARAWAQARQLDLDQRARPSTGANSLRPSRRGEIKRVSNISSPEWTVPAERVDASLAGEAVEKARQRGERRSEVALLHRDYRCAGLPRLRKSRWIRSPINVDYRGRCVPNRLRGAAIKLAGHLAAEIQRLA